MSTLENCPTEILREIFSSLQRTDLVHTSLLSHYFHSVTTSFLYKSVVLFSSAKGILFARTILKRKDLAKHITELQCNRSGTTFELHTDLVLTLLHAIPNLHKFTCAPLCVWMFENSIARETIPGRSTSNSFSIGVQSLREIECGLDMDDDPIDDFGVDTAMLIAMMEFPSIRKIRASMMELEPLEDLDPCYAAKAGTSLVKQLAIIHYELDAKFLNLILQVPQGLTHFSYFDIGYERTSLADPEFSVAISHLQATLHFLELDFNEAEIADQDSPRQVWVPIVSYPAGIFRDWPHLTRIKSPILALLGKPHTPATLRLVSVLPLVIRELSLDNDLVWKEIDIVGQILDLVESKDAFLLTRLKIIEISHSLLDSSELQDQVAAACKAAGIEFRVVINDRIM